MTHSPEPWHTYSKDDAIIVDAAGNHIFCITSLSPDRKGGHHYQPPPVNDPDIARLIACVNACAGIPTEELNWVSVKERLPKEAGEYLVLFTQPTFTEPRIGLAYFSDRDGTLTLDEYTGIITHWRSIPQNRPETP